MRLPGCPRAVAAALVVLAASGSAAAHSLAPSYLELTENADATHVVWKTPRAVARGVRLEPVLPCAQIAATVVQTETDAIVERWAIDCGGASLAGRELSVRGLSDSRTDALVRVVLADGRELQTVLSAGKPAFTVPARESRGAVARSHLELGVGHLLGGPDHVLFAVGLAALLGASRRLFWAISSFTLGHSVTLALAALGIARLPSTLVETGIALSLVVLARELVHASHRGLPAAPRYATSMPFAFGLLHGLGFAGALVEIGLPQHAVPVALLGFNTGIELGQLGVVALALPLLVALQRLRMPAVATELPATAIGTLGVYWLISRTLSPLLG